MSIVSDPFTATATTHPPAKLNLFLELLRRREDGFHEIDTVMVPVDWRDDLTLRRTVEPGIELSVAWQPSVETLAEQLGVPVGSEQAERLFAIPNDHTNLVSRALQRFADTFLIGGGFRCELAKRIPAGAGMGGASSDAAGALRCAAQLCNIGLDDAKLHEIAASIGSDVPFFLGGPSGAEVSAMRATGRGEQLAVVPVQQPLAVVAAFPAVTLSTAKVYSLAQVPSHPQNSCRLIEALRTGDLSHLGEEMMNRLTEPAKKLAPEISQLLESLWRSGLQRCQLTGSGSACFAIANSSNEASRSAKQVRRELQPGAIVMHLSTTCVPAPVEIT